MHRRIVPLLLIGVMLLAVAVRAALAWGELPEVMASHFGLSGRPDGWQGKTAFFITYSAIFGVTLWVLLAIGKLLQRMPAGMINIPHREYWLTPERRPEAIERLTTSMDWLGVALTVVLTGTLELVIRANIARQPLDGTLMIALLIAFFAFQIAWLVHLWRRFKPA